MDQTAAIYTVIATLLCGFGLTMVLAASIERRSIIFACLVVLAGLGCGYYSYTLDPQLSAARVPLAFIELTAMAIR